MTQRSALKSIYEKGIFGDCENKNEVDLLKLSESKNLLIVQIVQYKNSNASIEQLKITSPKSKIKI